MASDDARVAAAKEYSKVQNATKAALEAKEKADKALADAKEEAEADPDEPECVIESGFTTVVTGLPSKIVAGSTTDFFLRVKNGTKKTLHQVSPFVFFHATDKTGYNVIDGAFRLQWSTAASPKWKSVNDGTVGSLGALKAGARADVKLRLKVDAKAPAGDGLAFVAGDYVNNDESCGGNFPTEYAFELLAAGSAPGDVDDAEPGKSTPTAPNTEPQGGTSATSVDAAAPRAPSPAPVRRPCSRSWPRQPERPWSSAPGRSSSAAAARRTPLPDTASADRAPAKGRPFPGRPFRLLTAHKAGARGDGVSGVRAEAHPLHSHLCPVFRVPQANLRHSEVR